MLKAQSLKPHPQTRRTPRKPRTGGSAVAVGPGAEHAHSDSTNPKKPAARRSAIKRRGRTLDLAFRNGGIDTGSPGWLCCASA